MCNLVLILQVSHTGCCILNDEVWICGGMTAAVYSWRGPGNKWTKQPSLPEGMWGHKAVYDGDKAVWVLTGYDNDNVYKYQLGTASWTKMEPLPSPPAASGKLTSQLSAAFWKTMEPLPQWRSNSGCVRHGQHIFSLGGSILGEGATNTILITNKNTGNTFTSDIKLPHKVSYHCVAIIQPTTTV